MAGKQVFDVAIHLVLTDCVLNLSLLKSLLFFLALEFDDFFMDAPIFCLETEPVYASWKARQINGR